MRLTIYQSPYTIFDHKKMYKYYKLEYGNTLYRLIL